MTRIARVSNASVAEAAEIIKNGGLVAFPTETVYGLGADAFNGAALSRIYEAKGRPADNPLIIHINDISQVAELAEDVPEAALRLMEGFWPGPLTVIMRKTKSIPFTATGGRDTVAVRLPSHEAARMLIRLSGTLIAAPSANTSGRPSPTDAAHVTQDLWGKIDMILDGGSTCCGLESTVIDVTRGTVEILRPGQVTREMIESVLNDHIQPEPQPDNPSSESEARAPGMKYRHYAPLARAVLLYAETFNPGDIAAALNAYADARYDGRNKAIGILASQQTRGFYDADKYTVLVAGDRLRPETVAANLFRALRRFDELGVELILCEAYPETGIGAAVMNRLKKAAFFANPGTEE